MRIGKQTHGERCFLLRIGAGSSHEGEAFRLDDRPLGFGTDDAELGECRDLAVGLYVRCWETIARVRERARPHSSGLRNEKAQFGSQPLLISQVNRVASKPQASLVE